jgi:hypothetical protein
MPRLIHILFVLILITWCSGAASGQAFCALRDPVTGIFNVMPEATSYRSITRTVGVEHRSRIAARLPFTLHFNELGRHTLYLGFKNQVPIGLLHVRSDRGRYGLIEVAWHLDMGYRIVDVFFQRCRDDEAKRALEALHDRLVGSTFADLLELDSDDLSAEERMLVRSGLKTMAVTHDAWFDALLPYQAWGLSKKLFGEDSLVEQRRLDRSAFASGEGLDQDNAAAWTVRGPDGVIRGYMVRLDWTLAKHPLDLWWAVNADGTLRTLVRSTGDPDEETTMLFDQLKGMNREQLETCATAGGVVGRLVLNALDPVQGVHSGPGP